LAGPGDAPTRVAAAPAPLPETTDAALEELCRRIATRLRDGKVVPFLGAGANACGRPPLPPGTRWQPGEYLPTGQELADWLAQNEPYPPGEARDLVRVAQYLDLSYQGEGTLFEKLRDLFEPLYEPNALHELLVELAATPGPDGEPTLCPLIVTTNYDDVLERAFGDKVPYTVVYYAAEREKRGRFVELQPDGTPMPARRQGGGRGPTSNGATVILKIHGAFNRRDERSDSYVITEDHYIDYLSGANVAKLLPDYVFARMVSSHILFVGYGMRDWNLRVVLHHIWSEQSRRYGSWAIQYDPPDLDVKFWQRHGVQIENVRLERWVEAMRRQFA
jgi:SIR2-like domain